MKLERQLIALLLSGILLLSACGGHGAWSSNNDGGNTAPSAPANIAGNAGDGAVSFGWDAPAASTEPLGYNITIAPAAAAAQITVNGTHALVRGLSNDTTYTFSVTAKNNAGESTANTVLLQPTAVDINTAKYPPIVVNNGQNVDTNNVNGISDPALLSSSGKTWMAYSSIHASQQAGNSVQDVSTSLAFSTNGGASYTYLRTLGAATIAPDIVMSSTASPCGSSICSGRWVYEAPFLVDDRGDPNASQRFKLFTHKHFLFPANPDTSTLSAIVMWTAPSLDSNWSAEKSVLSWDSTPQKLVSNNNIGTIDPALTECIALKEGSAAAYNSGLDFVFACDNGTTRKIVLLRSTDHAVTFKYIATLLEAIDADAFSADYFSAPALLPSESNAPVLLVTPVQTRPISTNGVTINSAADSGCIAFPIADEATGTLFRSSSAPLEILQILPITNHNNGACGWDRGVNGSGILISDEDGTTSTVKFSILNSAKQF